MDRVKYRPNNNRSGNNNRNNALLSVYFSSFFAKIAFLGMSFFLFFNIFKSVNITAQKLEILERAEREVTELRVKNLKLGLQLEEMRKVSFLEVEARDRLNFAGDGETVFVIPENLLEKGRENIDFVLADGSAVLEDRSTMEVWLEWL